MTKTGTITEVQSNAQTYTGTIAQEFATGLLVAFTIQLEENAQIPGITSPTFVKSIGTTSVTLGPTKMTVTNYTAISTPLSYSYCGISSSITNLALSVGTAPGTNFKIVTYITESEISGGTTTSFSYSIQSLTVG
jgi:hypothetical protein